MSKKKRKKDSKKRAIKKAKQHQKKHLHEKTSLVVPIKNEEKSTESHHRALVATEKGLTKSETTFSKKLEEVISENSTGKKGFFKGKIILLGPPSGYGDVNWSGLWKRFTRTTVHFLIFLLIIATVCSAVVALEVLSDHRILPRVAFAQEEIGYQPLTEAQAAMTKRLADYQAVFLTFTYDDQTVEIPFKDLSISLEQEKTLDQLPVFNFQENNIGDLVGSNLTPRNILPQFKKDDQHIFNLIQNKLALSDKRAKSARFSLNDEKKLEIQPETDGVIINHSALMAAITDRVNNLSTTPIAVETLLEIPAVNTKELTKFQSDLQVKLENEIAIKYNGKPWKFKPTEHLGGIDFRKDNNQVTIFITPKLIEEYLVKEIFLTIEKPFSKVKIGYDDNDKVTFDGEVRNGLSVKKDQFISDLNLAINSLSEDVTIQTEETKAVLDVDPRLQAMGIRDLVGVGHTAFVGSPSNRRWNIATGMAKFQGIIVKPGETFSFNENLGEVDGSTGYKLELVIKGNQGTVPEYGGGICQVSSTFFKAALFSGLPIVERSPHSYAVGYYAQVDGYGLDSTIYPGVKDLKFTNNTPGSILIQTYIDGSDAYVNFFGTIDGRKVELNNYWRGNYRGGGGTQLIPTNTLPTGQKKQIESAHGGFDASWDRIITTADGKSTKENIYSVYRATSNRFLVGQ